MDSGRALEVARSSLSTANDAEMKNIPIPSASVPGIKREELIGVARAMLAGTMPLLQGVRAISSLRYGVGINPDDEVFHAFIGADDENYPIGAVRERWSKEALGKLDAEAESYLAKAAPGIRAACEQVIKKLSRISEFEVVIEIESGASSLPGLEVRNRMMSELLAAASATLSVTELDEVRHFEEHNERVLALETLVAIYVEEGKHAPDNVVAMIHRLAREMSMDADALVRFLRD